MRVRHQDIWGWALVGLLGLGTGCASEGSMSASGGGAGKVVTTSLYDRLGKKEAITAVVDDFVNRVANDNRFNGKFANANIPRLKTLLVEQICSASGGPATAVSVDSPNALASVPAIRPRVARPVNIRNVPAIRPFSVIGTMSP